MLNFKKFEEIKNTVQKFLKDNSIRYYYNEPHSLFQFEIPTSLPDKRMVCSIFIRDNSITFYAMSSCSETDIKSETANELAKYCAFLNPNMLNGNFEIDLDDGTFLYKTHLMCRGANPQQEDIHEIMKVAVDAMEKYGMGFLRIMMQGENASAMIREYDI